jgi:TRAP-type C4-dicarboxylate transport system permease small subunit
MQTLLSSPETNPRRDPFQKILDKASYWSSVWFERIGMVAIVAIILATLVDIIGAKIFHRPLAAGTEVIYFLQIVAIAGGLAFAQIDGRHVRLEFVDSFPKIVKAAFKFLSAGIGLGLFVILSWKSYQYGLALNAAHEVTAASRVPLFPFAFWIGLCCIPMCLVLLKNMVDSIAEVVKK